MSRLRVTGEVRRPGDGGQSGAQLSVGSGKPCSGLRWLRIADTPGIRGSESGTVGRGTCGWVMGWQSWVSSEVPQGSHREGVILTGKMEGCNESGIKL